MRATGMPFWSVTVGTTVTRLSASGSSSDRIPSVYQWL